MKMNIGDKNEKLAPLLTILTPSYNREKELSRLYDSLKKQTCKKFEWLVVDDGSTDKTAATVRKWEKEGSVCIHCIKKENGGKHTALNTGISKINSELTFIVDSDDWLPENAVEIILRYHEKWKDTDGLCGYSFLRFYPDGNVNEAFFPVNECIDTYVNARINGHIGGDKAEVFFTDILKRYPFPVFGKEKFLPEDLVWVRMSGPYKMLHVNECVYIGDYLADGLTRSGRRMKLHSPRGMMARAWVYLEDPYVNIKTKIKMAVLYDIYKNAADQHFMTEEEKNRSHFLTVLCTLPGKILYNRWRKKYR